MAGRPTKLTPELRDSIVSAIEDGNVVETACEAYGVSEDSFYEWMRRGKEEPGTAFSEFSDSVMKARGRAEMAAVSCLRVGMTTDPRFAVEWLKRARHKRWEPKQEVEVRHGALDALTDEQLVAKAAELHAKMGLILKPKSEE